MVYHNTNLFSTIITFSHHIVLTNVLIMWTTQFMRFSMYTTTMLYKSTLPSGVLLGAWVSSKRPHFFPLKSRTLWRKPDGPIIDNGVCRAPSVSSFERILCPFFCVPKSLMAVWTWPKADGRHPCNFKSLEEKYFWLIKVENVLPRCKPRIY